MWKKAMAGYRAIFEKFIQKSKLFIIFLKWAEKIAKKVYR